MITLESFEIQYPIESLPHGMEADIVDPKHLEQGKRRTPWLNENIEYAS